MQYVFALDIFLIYLKIIGIQFEYKYKNLEINKTCIKLKLVQYLMYSYYVFDLRFKAIKKT